MQINHLNITRYKIVFNGEIYNYLELRKYLMNTIIHLELIQIQIVLAAYDKGRRMFIKI